jgi:hypothetical protein
VRAGDGYTMQINQNWLRTGEHGPLRIHKMPSRLSGGKFAEGSAKVCLHTTESSPGASPFLMRDTLEREGYPVHFVANLHTGIIIQTLSMGVSAYGLANHAQRQTAKNWKWARGIVGHVHAPENDHWDPGDVNIPAVAAYAQGLDR